MRTDFNFVIWVTGARHLSHRCVWLVEVHLSGRLVSSKWNLYPPQSNSRWALSRDGPRLSATMVISYFKTLPPALCCQRAPGVPVKFTSGEQVQINKSLTDQERKYKITLPRSKRILDLAWANRLFLWLIEFRLLLQLSRAALIWRTTFAVLCRLAALLVLSALY